MAYFLNRATLKLHGGRINVKSLKQQARARLNNLLMAKRLGHVVGANGYRLFQRRYKLYSPDGVQTRANVGWGENFLRRLSFGENRAFIVKLEKGLRCCP
ncbi:hypothetical protein A3H38_05745 [candidate division WOR-1 bacterium RIFCSPLOWO2_02_FULL_46_20]|uniref:Uncharacterized protein n=2 Tax=Saganbacteria TaxID=1703751 RepID=A0A1F4RBC3_UNCSA|nr:MAG: hypothetical protein A3J44_05045 [candidate division WOR-1 bacterium RIFCSPHIGHO2_02_FULL_45_12]OGC05468.1 MAG: hypothetical protein A3H38_05745 [candidate division WOR-1 bacterium RIFCSPLOWO2_02_FULL_46_20]OGC09084.1 MAG: hypothetical protein A3F86_01785 [candidate division WOR-1 bacterium RIFCSPLOWO2_12_FULL_45_9]